MTATPAGAARSAPPPPLSIATLLRALRTGTAVPGQQAIDLPPPVLPDTRVRVTGSSALAVGTTLGLVLTLRNTQQAPLTLDLRLGAPVEAPSEGVIPLSTWTWPPRLTIRAVAAEDEVLAPASETRVYVRVRKEALTCRCFSTRCVAWSRRRPAVALLGSGLLGWLLYGYLSPSPPVARPVVAKTQTVPGIGTERAVMEKTLLDVQKDNATLKGALQDQERTLHQIQQAQQAAERERQAAMQAQEHRLEEILTRAQQAQRPPQAPAPRPHRNHSRSPHRLSRPGAALREGRHLLRGEQGVKVRILRSDKAASFAGPPPSVTRGDTPYLPAGSYAEGRLVTGVFATSRIGGALPVLFAVTKTFHGPFQLGGPGLGPLATALPIAGCLILGKAQADLASARVLAQLDTLSCVFPDGATFARPIKGYATGVDGTLGLPGRLETRDAAYLARTFLTSLMAGASEAFALAKRTTIMTPLGGTHHHPDRAGGRDGGLRRTGAGGSPAQSVLPPAGRAPHAGPVDGKRQPRPSGPARRAGPRRLADIHHPLLTRSAMTRHPLLTLLLATLPLTACTAALTGPEADLHAIATPDPVPHAVRPAPHPAPGPTPGTGRWRAWVPRQVQPTGDVTDGHWLELRLDPPAVDVLEPVTPMPRAPKTHVGGKRPAAPPTPVQIPVPSALTPTPVLPSGLVPPDGQAPPRVGRVPFPPTPLGGP